MVHLLSELSSESSSLLQNYSKQPTKCETLHKRDSNSNSNTNNSNSSNEKCERSTLTSSSMDYTHHEQIGFYFVIFFNSLSHIVHSKDTPLTPSTTSLSSSSSPKEQEIQNEKQKISIVNDDVSNNNRGSSRKRKDKLAELFVPFSYMNKDNSNNNNNVNTNNITREHVGDFYSLFSITHEVPHETLQTIAFPTTFGISENELTLVMTSSSSSSSSILELQSDINNCTATTSNNNSNSNNNSSNSTRLPCNCRISEVRQADGTLNLTHIILTCTFNTMRICDVSSMQSKRVGVALVLACPPSRRSEYLFLLSHCTILQTCLRKLVYFAMRSVYRYFTLLAVSNRFAYKVRQRYTDKLCEVLASCNDAKDIYNNIKENLNTGLRIHVPLPFLRYSGSSSSSSSSSHHNYCSCYKENVLLPLVWYAAQQYSKQEDVAIVETLSSALYDAVEYVLKYDAAFASAFVMSLLNTSHEHNNNNNNKCKENILHENYWSCVNESYWLALQQRLEHKCTTSTSTHARSVIESNVNDQECVAQVLIICKDVKLGISLLIVAAFLWRFSFTDNNCSTHDPLICEWRNKEECEYLHESRLEEHAHYAFENAIAGVVIHNCNNKRKNFLTSNTSIKWVYDEQLCQELEEEQQEQQQRYEEQLHKQSSYKLSGVDVADKDSKFISKNHILLEPYTHFVDPYDTFNKLIVIEPHQHTCQELLIERKISASINVEIKTGESADCSNNNNNNKSNSMEDYKLVENPFSCIVKEHQEIKPDDKIANMLQESLRLHEQSHSVVPVTLTLPRMMQWRLAELDVKSVNHSPMHLQP